MKKVLTTGLLAIALIALTEQQASAWVNSRFSIGLNAERQSGGNGFGWGAWVNGQPPGPEVMQSYQTSARGATGPQTYPPPYLVPYSQQGSFEAPSTVEPPYANSSVQYGSPYQFATYPRLTLLSDALSYYYGR